MSAQSARSADRETAQSGTIVVRLLHKAVVMDAALRLVAAGDLQPQDMAVLWYIASSLDRQTGEAIRRYQTIADGCGMSRATAVRAMARLKDAGVIEIKARYFRNQRGKMATAYRLGALPPPRRATAADEAQIGAQVNRGSVHECTGNGASHDFHIPVGGPSQRASNSTEPDDGVDWGEIESWLSDAGQYVKRWGFGAEGLAKEDLDRWRREKGERAITRAIANARAKRLYGEVLIDFLEKTYASGAGRPRPNRPRTARGGLRPIASVVDAVNAVQD
jgi:DNA-binding transcriptional ArsR family regulator